MIKLLNLERHYRPETKRQLASPLHFFVKMLKHFGLAILLLVFSLVLGAAGYHFTENLPWLDSFLNASMILTGMGPVDVLRTDAGKLFAICYSLFSGVVFLTAATILFSPVAHRIFKRVHLESR
jgi:hypothetical protein